MKKTLKNFIENSNINPNLIRAVIRQSGGWIDFQEKAPDISNYEKAPDISNYGISGGFSGWIYYNETCTFYAKNQTLVVELAECQSAKFGYSSAQDMVKSFRSSLATLSEIGHTLYGNKRQHDTQVANALAWFAAEEVARSFVDWVDSE
jgi:hypothetical protein